MEKVDFLVVGGGIAGLSAAARLARYGRTVVCEGEAALGVHASGRSAAFAHFGIDDALVRALTAASLPLFSEPGAVRHPALFVARSEGLDALDTLAAHHREWSTEAQRLTGAEVRARVPVLRDAVVAGLLHEDGRKLDADALLQDHRRVLKEAGGTLLLGAPVTALRHDGNRWISDTAGASFAAGVVVNAAGAWADGVAAMAGVRPIGLQPRRRTVITFAGPDGVDVSSWPFVKSAGTELYFEAESTGRLLASPMDATPAAPGDARPEEEDVALAAWRMEEWTTLRVQRIASKWAGLRTFAPDERPVVGFDEQAPGFFWLAGQGGFGLQTLPAPALAAEALATRAPWPEELAAVGVGAAALAPDRLAGARSNVSLA